MNPDCISGKHDSCDGSGWDHEKDEPGSCPCTCHKAAESADPDVMLEGESYEEYVDRFENKGYSEKELHQKAIAAWYTRREVYRRKKD